MTEKSRQQEDRSNMLKGSPGSNPPLQAGLMSHPFVIPSEPLGMPTPHPLAYGIMHQPLAGMGRVTSNVSNDLGPPIFMPSLNLGVPRQQTSNMSQQTMSSKPPKNSLTQPPIMATSFMSEVMSFPPQSLIFHPSPVRQGQSAYISPSSPVNMKLTSKAGPTKPLVTKSQGVVRPTPKQPTSLPPTTQLHTKPASTAVCRPKGESPVEHLTYVPSPTQVGPYVISHPMVSQKGSTLSKMLMTPAQQQTSIVSSTGLPQQKGVAEMGGAYVSHNTTLRSAVPTLTSMAAGSHTGKSLGSFTSVVPDGYANRLSDHMTTSGQPTSTSSFTDTKTERPPQPSAASSPSSQPLPQVGVAPKDKSNIIIKGSSLTGRHIAAITNNTTTLQHTGGGVVQSAYATNSQASAPQTVDSIKSEFGPADTGWIQPHPPPDHATMASGNQLFGNLIQQSGKIVPPPGGGTVVPTATAPGVMGLSTHTHSPGGSNLLGSPGRHVGLPHPQGAGSSPRPQILRKRALESSLPPGEFPPVPQSPTSDGGVAPHNHVGGRPDASDVSISPRKKPRKQNVIANDDLYASNVPDSLSSSSASSLDTPLSGDGSEESGRNLGSTAPSKTHRVKGEPLSNKDGGPCEVEVRYLSQLRRCPYPISPVYKVCHKAPHNHFRQHSDIKHRDNTRQSAVEMASDRYVHQRASGWRVHHVLTQIDEMSRVERELLEQVESICSLTDDMRENEKCHIDTEYINSLKELAECDVVRSNRILSHMDSTQTRALKILDHRRQVTELLNKCTPRNPLPSPILTNHHKTRS